MIGSFILESFTPAKVTCSICGETSHLARDCPLRHDRKKVEESRKRDQAYLEFMSELDGEPMPRKREKKEAISGKVEESDDMQVDEPSNGPAVAVQPVGGMVPVMMPGVIAYAPVGAMVRWVRCHQYHPCHPCHQYHPYHPYPLYHPHNPHPCK